MRSALRALLSGFFIQALLIGQVLTPDLDSIVFPLVPSATLYGLQNGSPLRSPDNGKTWIPIYVSTAGLPQHITAMAVQPDDPAIVYAITSTDKGGIWKSINSGATFSPARAGLPGGAEAVLSFTIASNSPRTIFARVGDRIFRSTDAGQSWLVRGTLPTGASAVGVSPKVPAQMFTMTDGGRVFRSTDEGLTWRPVGTVQPEQRNRFATSFVFDPLDPNIVYVFSAIRADRSGCEMPGSGLWMTRDAGDSWSNNYAAGYCNAQGKLMTDPQRPILHLITNVTNNGQYCRSTSHGVNFTCRSGVVLPLAVDPRNGDTVFGGSGRSISNDAGISWQSLGSTIRPTLPVSSVQLELEQDTTGYTTIRIVTPESASYEFPFTATVTSGLWLRSVSRQGITARDFRLDFSAAGLSPGNYQSSLLIESSSSVNSSTVIAFQLRVVPRAESGLRYALSKIIKTPNVLVHLGRDIADNIFGYSILANQIFRIAPSGEYSAYLGTGVRGTSPNGTSAPKVMLNYVRGMTIDGGDNLVFSEGDAIRTIRGGVLQTLIDENTRLPDGGRFSLPGVLAVDNANRIYIAMSGKIIRRLPTGEVEPVYSWNTGLFPFISSMAVASDGTLYITDEIAHRLYRVRGGLLTVFAGTGRAGFSGDGSPAISAELKNPKSILVDKSGNVIFSDSGNGRVRAITPNGTIFTVIGGGSANPGSGLSGGDIELLLPSGLVINTDGNLTVYSLSQLFRFSQIRSPRPEIASSGMRNAASGSEAIAPGTLFSLFGANFSVTEGVVSQSTWPTNVSGVSVLLNGAEVPLYFVSPGQINGQIPFELSPGTVNAQVRTAAGTSNPLAVSIVARSPGILQYAVNRAVAVNPDGSINTEDNPISGGDILIIYLTGIGAVDNAVATGSATPVSPLSRPTGPVRVNIGDKEAEVLYLGLAPGFVGLAQANVRVPKIVGTSPVTISIDDSLSNSALISIKE